MLVRFQDQIVNMDHVARVFQDPETRNVVFRSPGDVTLLTVDARWLPVDKPAMDYIAERLKKAAKDDKGYVEVKLDD